MLNENSQQGAAENISIRARTKLFEQNVQMMIETNSRDEPQIDITTFLALLLAFGLILILLVIYVWSQRQKSFETSEDRSQNVSSSEQHLI